MIYRFSKQFRIMTGFLADTQYKGKFLYLDPITGETLKFKPKNLYRSVGYPGSTLWYRAILPGRETPPEETKRVIHDASLDLDEEGFLIIKMKDGRIVNHGKTRRLVHMSKDIERFRAFMEDQIKRLNEDVKTLLDVHLEAAPPGAPRLLYPEVFFEPYPDPYIINRLWFFGLISIILAACFALPESDNPLPLGVGLAVAAAAMLAVRIKGVKDYDVRLNQWEERKLKFEEKQQEFIEEWNETCANGKDQDAILGMALDSFDWPRETNVCWEFKNGGSELHLDIDLPLWDELPAQTWKVGADKVTLERGIMNPYDCRERYVRHVHSLVFLAASAAFWSVPELKTLYISAFCEDYVEPEPIMEYPRPTLSKKKKKDKGPDPDAIILAGAHPPAPKEISFEAGTGTPVYLLSLKIEQDEWARVDFSNLDKINPVFVMENFEMRRNLNAETMVLSAVEPY